MTAVLRVWLRNFRLITSFYCFIPLVLHTPVLFLWSFIFRSCIFKCFIFFGPPFTVLQYRRPGYLNLCSIRPPFSCTTHCSRRLHWSILSSMNRCDRAHHSSTIACFIVPSSGTFRFIGTLRRTILDCDASQRAWVNCCCTQQKPSLCTTSHWFLKLSDFGTGQFRILDCTKTVGLHLHFKLLATDFEELLDELLYKILNNSTHTLHTLLPPQSIASQHYHLRRRNHDRQLPTQTSHL